MDNGVDTSRPVSLLRPPSVPADLESLRALQLERMQWSLRHAHENVPHYRGAFEEAGVTPDDLRELSDLARFPFTTKADLRDNYPFGMFAVPREKVSRIHASSGTPGRPTVVGYTKEAIATWAEVMARSIEAAGGRAGDRSSSSVGTSSRSTGRSSFAGVVMLGNLVRSRRCRLTPKQGG